MVSKHEVDAELNAEIAEECSKHGKVDKVVIWIDPASASDDVNIYVKFAQQTGELIIAHHGAPVVLLTAVCYGQRQMQLFLL
jgi:hypothetical protein